MFSCRVVLSCCSFAHDQEALEVSEVLFERDEKRGSDTLYAVGWNAKVREGASYGAAHDCGVLLMPSTASDLHCAAASQALKLCLCNECCCV
jgi:hypothetical protein